MKMQMNNSKIIVRDDDISYFTQPEDLEKVWSNLYGKVEIIFAITPFMVELKECEIKGREYKYHQLGNVEHDIFLNNSLIGYLKRLISKGYIKIAMHGYNHRYILDSNKNLIAEYSVNDLNLLTEKTIKGRQHIEKIFNQEIDIFVPPDNAIGKCGLQAIRTAGFKKVLRTFPIRIFDAKITKKTIQHWMERVKFRIIFKIVYSKPIYNGFTEEIACYLYKGQSIEKLKEDFKIYKKYDLPFIIATHYWECNSYKENLIAKFILEENSPEHN